MASGAQRPTKRGRRPSDEELTPRVAAARRAKEAAAAAAKLAAEAASATEAAAAAARAAAEAASARLPVETAAAKAAAEAVSKINVIVEPAAERGAQATDREAEASDRGEDLDGESARDNAVERDKPKAGGQESTAGGGQDRGGEPPAPSQPTPADEGDSEALRREVHALIGQVEALLSLSRDHIQTWCAEDLRAAYEASHERLGPAFGKLHAQVAIGEHDKDLYEQGFAGEHLEFKRRGLLAALGAVVQTIRGRLWNEMPDRIGLAAEAGATVVGSIAEALHVATPIKEVVEIIPIASKLFKRQRQE